MKRTIHIIYVFALSLLLIPFNLDADAFSQNKKLGRGINMGNMLEAPSEGDWGPVLKEEYFQLIAEKGFSSVRIPIRWSSAGRANKQKPYTISEKFFKRVDKAIDAALESKLAVVINFHHYEEIFNNPDAEWERFLAIWKQISERYKKYPDELVFEILNEPHGNLNAEKWNQLLAETMAIIRAENPDRTVVIGTAEWGGAGSLNKLKLPENDKNLILTAHLYSPFTFTHQGAHWVNGSDAWLGTEWHGTYYDKTALINELEIVNRFSKEHNIPVYMGEFGAFRKADMASRVRWTSFCARLFEKMGFSWSYWEFCAEFGIYDPDARTWRKGLLDALISDDTSILETGSPEKITGKDILVNGDFSRTNENWTFGAWVGQAEGIVENNVFVVKITDPGTANWNIQLLQTGLALQDGTAYLLSFDAWSEKERIIAVGVENSENYTSYGGLGAQPITPEKKTYFFQFTKKGTDTNARVSFSFGGEDTTVYIDNVQLIQAAE